MHGIGLAIGTNPPGLVYSSPLRTQQWGFLALKTSDLRRTLFWQEQKELCVLGSGSGPRHPAAWITDSVFLLLVLYLASACACPPDGSHSVLPAGPAGSEISMFPNIQNPKMMNRYLLTITPVVPLCLFS